MLLKQIRFITIRFSNHKYISPLSSPLLSISPQSFSFPVSNLASNILSSTATSVESPSNHRSLKLPLPNSHVHFQLSGKACITAYVLGVHLTIVLHHAMSCSFRPSRSQKSKWTFVLLYYLKHVSSRMALTDLQ